MMMIREKCEHRERKIERGGEERTEESGGERGQWRSRAREERGEGGEERGEIDVQKEIAVAPGRYCIERHRLVILRTHPSAAG